MAKKSSSKANKAKNEIEKQLKKKSTTSKKTTAKKQTKSNSSVKKVTNGKTTKKTSTTSKKQVPSKSRSTTKKKTNKTKVVKKEIKEKEELLVPFEDSGKDKIIVPEDRDVKEKESIRDSIFIVNEVKDKKELDSFDDSDVLIDDDSSFYTTDLSIDNKEESTLDDLGDVSEFDFTDKLEKVDVEKETEEPLEDDTSKEDLEQSVDEGNILDEVNVLVDSDEDNRDVIITSYQDDYEDVFNFSNNDDYSEYKEDLSDTGNLLKQKEDELQSLYEKDSNDIVIDNNFESLKNDEDNNKDEFIVDNRTTTDKILNGIVIALFGIFILLLIAFIIFVIYICTY